jgi:hypothetical protein
VTPRSSPCRWRPTTSTRATGPPTRPPCRPTSASAGCSSSCERLIEAFLAPPLYRSARDRGGTLYTAVYDPAAGTADYRWPEARINESLQTFIHATHVQCYATADADADAEDERPPQLITSDP